MHLLMKSRVACAAAILLLAVAAGPAGAQEGTPSANVVLVMPTAIYPGICGESGELGAAPAYELGLLGPTAGEEADIPRADEVRGLQLSPPVMILEEPLNASFEDLLGSPHAMVIRHGEDRGFVACGQLGGVVDDGRLAVGLRPLTDERFFGVAVLTEAADSDVASEGQLAVTVYVFQEQGPIGPLGHDSTPTADVSP